jgi:CelD/BcsL family acetyltransferase involved in cellulose biosynthesis
MEVVEVGDPRWLELVRASPQAGPFHHPAWASLLADAYDRRPFVLACIDDAGTLVAGLPVLETARPLRRPKWVSLPYTDHCDPLRRDEVPAQRLADEFEEARRAAGVASFEVRSDLGASAAHRSYGHVVHELRLGPDSDEPGRGRSAIRRNVRKAERSGVRIRRGDRPSDLDTVFYGLHQQTRRRLGVPVQPRSFFRMLWERIVEPGLGFVALAEVGTEAVAGAVFLQFNGTLVYKYGASDHSAWPLRPNDLLFWTVLRRAAEDGARVVDFGRTDLADAGLRRFKAGWGADERPLGYTSLADHAPRPATDRLGALARPALRRCPAWVSRAVGEVLYRYAA